MFLKRIEMQGFKSFADKTILSFEEPITGIVGPNGCGKSNISDAIRWVLGEQSIKSLRGEKMTDVIFQGAENRRALNSAYVTLVFDNSLHLLNSQEEEIEITRRIYNTEQDGEYLINHKPVRLKDIHDLILDSGLGKDSLSMVSQGSITSFAEAKPYERRAVFEEAAGVAKYKKKKIESLARLERTKNNLDRAYDILAELEKQVGPLKRQANKAQKYLEMKNRLEDIEIAYLVKNINDLNIQKEALSVDKNELDSKDVLKRTSLNVLDNKAGENKTSERAIDSEITSLQDEYIKVVNNISHLEAQKTKIEEKRKYKAENADNKQKIIYIQTELKNAQDEYEDRLKRKEKNEAEIVLLNKQLDECLDSLMNANYQREEKAANYLKLANRYNSLENLLKDPFSRNQAGVKTILDHKQNLNGILGVVGQEMHPLDGYEEAISAALAGSTYHIVTKDEYCARKAIVFLRENKGGRATFLPLNVIKKRSLSFEQKTIAENSSGYLGLCSDFVECDEIFSIVNEALLANIILCDNLDNANELAGKLNYSCNIVTLDGDIVHRGGTLTGGKVKNSFSIVTAENELNRLKNELISAEAASKLAQKEKEKIEITKNKIENNITNARIALASLESILEIKRAKYDSLRSEYEALGIKNKQENEHSADSLIDELNNAYKLKDDLTLTLKNKREERLRLNADIERDEAHMRILRKEIDNNNKEIQNLISSLASLSAKLDENLNRLSSEYKMTYEFAKNNIPADIKEINRQEVNDLRDAIKNLGNINMDAPSQYEEINTRYEQTKKNYDELSASRDKLLAAIDEMDKTMKKQFKETFDDINKALPDTFKALFGGGKAKLILEDENDLLNSGVDIDVQPPGKAVKSIRLFSGGEKTLIAMCVLFTIMKIRKIPLILFDEVEAALDEANVEMFANYIRQFGNDSQFLIITHRPGTMEKCDVLYGITMQKSGVSQVIKVHLTDAVKLSQESEKN